MILTQLKSMHSKLPDPPMTLPFQNETAYKMRKKFQKWKADQDIEYHIISDKIRRNTFIDPTKSKTVNISKPSSPEPDPSLQRSSKSPSFFQLVSEIDMMMDQTQQLKNKISVVRKQTCRTKDAISRVVLKKEADLLMGIHYCHHSPSHTRYGVNAKLKPKKYTK